MAPVSPVIPGYQAKEVVYAKDQPEYTPLPVIKNGSGQVTSRWVFTDEDRRLIANGADLFVSVLTFHHSLQPMILGVARVVDNDPPGNLFMVKSVIGDEALEGIK